MRLLNSGSELWGLLQGKPRPCCIWTGGDTERSLPEAQDAPVPRTGRSDGRPLLGQPQNWIQLIFLGAQLLVPQPQAPAE